MANSVSIPETIEVLDSHEMIDDNVLDKLVPPFVVKPNGGF
jgi:hypothetical protein